MKKAFALLLTTVIFLSLSACGKEKVKGFEIPDVFGLDYTSASSLLESEDFEVTSIETDVANFAEKLLYPLEKVSKGTVFKVDDFILDGKGNLTKNYDIAYEDDTFVSEDKTVVIYYAKEDYIKSGESNGGDTTENSSSKIEASSSLPEKEKHQNTNSIGTEFKSAMDSYENFMNEYVDFIKKYEENPTDFNLLADYASYMGKYADFVEKFEKWEDEDLNAAELDYYSQVQLRVSKKLLEVSQ